MTKNSDAKNIKSEQSIVIVDDDMVIEDDEETKPPLDTKTIKIPCFKCNLVFPMDEFPNHQATHKITTTQQEINCTECGMAFDTIDNLMNHMKVLHFSMWTMYQYYNPWNQMAMQMATQMFEPNVCVEPPRRWADVDRHRRRRSPSHRRRHYHHHHHRGHRHMNRRSPKRRRRSRSRDRRCMRKPPSTSPSSSESPIFILDSDEDNEFDGDKEGDKWVVADSA
ncbi:unnamed protein product [Ceutorhynchus assimilis]|uniref:C2H2-type domain-containing protein n=1 Tax=Ceutorhynchus assimilis TaxID=467358 RepID=A0A9N9QKY9_9CUCU|nr:unnamed protein product [Ceutorhynchus assimilis]